MSIETSTLTITTYSSTIKYSYSRSGDDIISFINVIYYTTFTVIYTIVFTNTEDLAKYDDTTMIKSSTIIIISVICGFVAFVVIGIIIYILHNKNEESKTSNSYSDSSSSNEHQPKLFKEPNDNETLGDFFNGDPKSELEYSDNHSESTEFYL
jgi:hypothetical protein